MCGLVGLGFLAQHRRIVIRNLELHEFGVTAIEESFKFLNSPDDREDKKDGI